MFSLLNVNDLRIIYCLQLPAKDFITLTTGDETRPNFINILTHILPAGPPSEAPAIS